MKNPCKNTSGLRAFSEQKNRETLEKVDQAITALKRKKKTINFNTISAEAGISKTTLYNNPSLRERIIGLRSEQKTKHSMEEKIVQKDNCQLQEEKIMALREKVRQLETDKEKLILQLVHFERLKQENERLKNTLQMLTKGK